MKRICVFLGSSPGRSPLYARTARELGREMARRGLGLVYGGADMGLMAVLASTVLEAGGEAVGVVPRVLKERELAHQGLTATHLVDTLAERKDLMVRLSDGFIALPGGLGTLDELSEVLAWAQLGFHRKPCGLLNINAFFSPLLAFLDTARDEGFIAPPYRDLLITADHPAGLLDAFQQYVPPVQGKWVNRETA